MHLILANYQTKSIHAFKDETRRGENETKLKLRTCFVFHVKRDCKSAVIFIVMLTCKKSKAVHFRLNYVIR